MSYRIVIPTAGIGSRLNNLTKYLNKSLVSIAHRPTLCHLIEQFPEDCEFVIALGYKGHLVREFIEISYPERSFYYVDVDPYKGNGAGLGYSLLCCEEYLQQPFVFISCDTLVKERIPSPSYNWLGYSEAEEISSYRNLNIQNKLVSDLLEKGDTSGNNLYPYIGLAGIKNYAEFWTAMHQGDDIAINQGEAYGIRCLLKKNNFKAQYFTWYDTGTLNTLEHTRAVYRQPNEPNILEKQNEAIWFIGDQVIKFSDDESFIANRVKRSSSLKGFVPDVINSSNHMYSYKKEKGKVLSEVITVPLFKNLLHYCKDFWRIADLSCFEVTEFENSCRSFYQDKTIKRVSLFYQNFNKVDACETINDEPMPLLSSLLGQVDWNYISKGLPGRFHGDFHFENIIWKSGNQPFVFLDWRQDFAGNLELGDIYYDLAKLLHGLIISHDLIAANCYSIEWDSKEIRFDLTRHHIHVECEKYFFYWCKINGYDFSKVRLLTALIYLNIAALHHRPYSLMLYALGKQMLYQELQKQ